MLEQIKLRLPGEWGTWSVWIQENLPIFPKLLSCGEILTVKEPEQIFNDYTAGVGFTDPRFRTQKSVLLTKA